MPSTSSPSTILLAARFADPLIASLGTGHCFIGPFPGPFSTAVCELPAPLAASVRALVRGLTGRRVGIYGLGAIGVKITRRVVACEARVGYHNRNPRTDVPYDYFPSLVALAHWADALVVAVRGDQSTRHAVDAAVLRALGSEGHVVNISRGFVIDEAALIAALRDGTVAGAGLDVFEHEPQVPQALRELPNVALAPHVGGATLEAQAAMGAMVRRNLDAFFAGEALPNRVPGVWT